MKLKFNEQWQFDHAHAALKKSEAQFKERGFGSLAVAIAFCCERAKKEKNFIEKMEILGKGDVLCMLILKELKT